MRDGTVHGTATTVERLVSRGYTNAEKTLAANYMPGDVVAFHRPYKSLGLDKGDELRVARVGHGSRSVNLEGADGRSVAGQPIRIAARARGGGVPKRDIEIRAHDRIRWTRNDAGLGLVNTGTAEVAAVRDRKVTFRLEDGHTLHLSPSDPHSAVSSAAWGLHRAPVPGPGGHRDRGEAVHHHLTTQKSFCVDITHAGPDRTRNRRPGG